jgi:integrase
MGRKRLRNKNLPQRVYVHRGRYRYVPKSGKPVSLAPVSDYAGMLRKLARVIEFQPSLTTLDAIFDRYLLEVVPNKADSTQADNSRAIKRFKSVFGHLNPGDFRPCHAAEYRDRRGASAPTSANRELELLSHVFTKAAEWGAVDRHPIKGLVSKIPIPPRRRYVTDNEYKIVYRLASPMVRCVMDLALLTGLRRGDIFKLRRENLTDEGVEIVTSKTGARILYKWSPALRKVVKEALRLKPQVRSWIVCNRKGRQYTKNGFDSVWNRLLKKAEKKIERFQFRDLRAKNASDEPELSVAQARLGHTSPAITKLVYVRTPTKVRPLR